MDLEENFTKNMRHYVKSYATDMYERAQKDGYDGTYEKFCETKHVIANLSVNTWLEILSRIDGDKVQEPLTADQKNDYLQRYMAEAVGDVQEREQKYAPLNGYGMSKIQDPTDKNPANLIVSKLKNGNHLPSIDIDMPCKLIPSKTPGHYHLFFDKELTWESYQLLLNAMAIVGIVEKAYVDASVARGMTCIRLSPEELLADEIQKKVDANNAPKLSVEDDPGAIVGTEKDFSIAEPKDGPNFLDLF